ncbi:phage Gp37/Gp68 family protein [Salinarimonas sp. NSM]|uniref:phage Gp37/Gp68 family protein n=1 Tax=Salinarimonas sp. NSM TaxID=3458003 RepID=UPI0040361C10
MAENSAIEWTAHTFNPWIGCAHVGPGCDHCYAEALMDKRHGRAQWGGPGKGVGTRVRTAPSTWRQPHVWNRKAAAAGRRERVFCASLADVFDNAVPDEWRADLAALILATPSLDWLLLTKRIGNARGMLRTMFPAGVPANVWLGATVVNQAEADRDVPKLLRTKDRLSISVAFLSCEPLLGPIDLARWLETWEHCSACGADYPTDEAIPDEEGHPNGADQCAVCGDTNCMTTTWGWRAKQLKLEIGSEAAEDVHSRFWLNWIIVGGESGAGARPMHPDWARSLRDQCAAAGVPFFMKQMSGVRKPLPPIPDDLMVREFPRVHGADPAPASLFGGEG